MSGSPTETEVQTQWRNTVAILEYARAYADATLAGQLDTLSQSLEGEYTASDLPGLASSFRANVSSLINPGTARALLTPVIFEYARLLDYGSGFRTVEEIMPALREHFVANSLSVRSRGLTFGSASAAGGNVGNGTIVRLSVDRWGEDIESVTPEVKRLRCVADQNSGARENAELFEIMGEAESSDALLRGSFGSGASIRQTIEALHAGQGSSILRNGSFATFNPSGTPKFTAWTETSGSANVAQEAGVGFRLVPGSTTLDSLRLNGAAVLTQALTTRTLSPTTPYRYRVMVNPTVGSASGGTLTIRLGSRSASLAVASMSSGWQELSIALNENSYLPNFQADPLTVTIEWASASSGYLLIDDVMLNPLTRVDGTWLGIVGGATPFLLDDEFTITDSGGAPGTGEINYWLWIAGLGYLPSVASSETFSDPA